MFHDVTCILLGTYCTVHKAQSWGDVTNISLKKRVRDSSHVTSVYSKPVVSIISFRPSRCPQNYDLQDSARRSCQDIWDRSLSSQDARSFREHTQHCRKLDQAHN